MANKFELVNFDTVSDINIFVVEMTYRGFHLHKELEFIYVLNGAVSISIELTQQTVHKGECILINSYQLHEMAAEQSATILIIQLDLSSVEKVFPTITELQFSFLPMPIVTTENKILYHLNQIYKEYFTPRNFSSLLCHGFLSLILFDLTQLIPYSRISEERKTVLLQENDLIYRINKYIHLNFDQKILLTDIAKAESISPSYMSHFFRDKFGLSFQDYLKMVRCSHAYTQLVSTNKSITAISDACGFSNLRYLKKALWDIYNCSPAEIRKNKPVPLVNVKFINTAEKEYIYTKSESIKILDLLI
ncbi:MAG: helix-turn-helix domain-containing protein [Enterococcus sp.]